MRRQPRDRRHDRWLAGPARGRPQVGHRLDQARCPAHDDKNPSLSIAEGAGGKVLVTCHAASLDCTFEAIRDALWPQGTDTGGASTPAAPRTSIEAPATAVTARRPRKLPDGPHDTVNIYHHADSSVAFASVRNEAPGRAKRFSQWTPAEDGLWYDRKPPQVAAALPCCRRSWTRSGWSWSRARSASPPCKRPGPIWP